jgi:hypothetical protein
METAVKQASGGWKCPQCGERMFYEALCCGGTKLDCEHCGTISFRPEEPEVTRVEAAPEEKKLTIPEKHSVLGQETLKMLVNLGLEVQVTDGNFYVNCKLEYNGKYYYGSGIPSEFCGVHFEFKHVHAIMLEPNLCGAKIELWR